MKVVVHVAASSGVTRVELMSCSGLEGGRSQCDGRECRADSLSDGSHDVGVRWCNGCGRDAKDWQKNAMNADA